MTYTKIKFYIILSYDEYYFFLEKGAPLLFLYELSIVVLIDFIAMLLTPGIFLIQIVNTNMYLIHFQKNKRIFKKLSF